MSIGVLDTKSRVRLRYKDVNKKQIYAVEYKIQREGNIERKAMNKIKTLCMNLNTRYNGRWIF